ncbi:Uncharacterised protein [Serratia proteamaculans]|nr:Uncharacterised protein [Serratia proteamaculans]
MILIININIISCLSEVMGVTFAWLSKLPGRLLTAAGLDLFCVGLDGLRSEGNSRDYRLIR